MEGEHCHCDFCKCRLHSFFFTYLTFYELTYMWSIKKSFFQAWVRTGRPNRLPIVCKYECIVLNVTWGDDMWLFAIYNGYHAGVQNAAIVRPLWTKGNEVTFVSKPNNIWRTFVFVSWDLPMTQFASAYRRLESDVYHKNIIKTKTLCNVTFRDVRLMTH